MRIGLVTDFYAPWVGGPASAVRALAFGLLNRGHEVEVLAPSPTGARYREYDGALPVVRAATVPFPIGFQLRYAHRPVGEARRWLRRFGPDVVHVHHPFPLSASALLQAPRLGVPVVATSHTIPACSLWGLRDHPLLYGLSDMALGGWIRRLLSRASTVSTPTESAALLLRDLGFDKPVTVISNGVDTDRFSPGPESEELRTRLGLDSRPIVLYTGRLDAEKQMDVWLQAAAMLARETDVQLVVGGRGAHEVRLRALAAELGLMNHLRFIGYVSEADLPGLYRLASVYFICSPVELQSIATLEAIASGLPAVAVDAGALPELVRDGENGFLFPPGQAFDAARKLARLMHNVNMRSEFAARSRQLAVRHSLPATVEAYERWLIGAARGATGDRTVERIPGRG